MNTLSFCLGTVLRRQSDRVVSMWSLQSGRTFAGFFLGCTEFRTSAMLVNSQLVASCQLEFLIPLYSIWILIFASNII